MGSAKVYEEAFEPALLKALMADCDIGQAELARLVSDELGRSVSRPLINLAVNRGYEPPDIAGFRGVVERVVMDDPKAQGWLMARGLKVEEIWRPLGRDMRKVYPKGHGTRVWVGRKKQINKGDPTLITINEEVQMRIEALNPDAMKAFKLFKNPFLNDVTSEKDIFMSDEHRYIEAAMLDAALHGGFLAVIGEVGSGKSTIRKKVVENLLRDGNIAVIYPENKMIHVRDRYQSRIDATSLCDAIIMDISDERPKIKTEHKVRQLKRLLIARSNQGFKHVLIIEEAHNLTKWALKYLKQFFELEDGFKKLLSIILVGQPELSDMLDSRNPELREVAMRIQVAHIVGLNGNLRRYLEFKFKRIGATIENVFTDDFYEALASRLTLDDGRGRKVSHAYPALVNVYVINAMNLAHEMGETTISADVIMAL